jgi:putative ABC transport system permease protein
MWLFLRLALQNLGRKPARAALLAFTVAVAVGAVFATFVVKQAIQDSMAVGFDRMGADLVVVPRDTLVNLTPALLTVEPTPYTLDGRVVEEVARLLGVEAAAPQRYFSIPLAADAHAHDADVVAFDPRRDFTVLPWLQEKLDRPLQPGDVLVGGRREQAVGTTVRLGGQTLTVYGRLGLTGVGPFDRAFFLTFETASASGFDADPGKLSVVLVRLRVGTRPEPVRFALARTPEVKVVSGPSLHTTVRQGLTAVLGGAVALTALLLLAAVLMVSALYSGLLAERRRELGLLLAIGTRPRQLLRLILAEATLASSLGGVGGLVLGVGLLLLFRRSLGYHLESLHVPLVQPGPAAVALYALAGVGVASGVGLLGALVPAWRVSRQEPYDLVRAEGH